MFSLFFDRMLSLRFLNPDLFFLSKKRNTQKTDLRRGRRADGPGDDPQLALAEQEPADLVARGGEGGGGERGRRGRGRQRRRRQRRRQRRHGEEQLVAFAKDDDQEGSDAEEAAGGRIKEGETTVKTTNEPSSVATREKE